MEKQRGKRGIPVRLPAISSPKKPAAAEKESAPSPELKGLIGLQDVDVQFAVEWGRTEITIEEALNLGPGSLLRADQTADQPVEVRVNGKLFGRGRLVMVEGHYGVQLTELIEE